MKCSAFKQIWTMYLLTLMVRGNVPCWGYFDNMSYVRVGAAPHPQSSLFPPFSQDCLFPGRPGNCQRVSRGTSAQKPGKVLSANSSSVNIRPVGVALLLFVDCTNYVHVLMGFWRALFMQSGSGNTGHLCCVLIQDFRMLFGKEKGKVGTNLPKSMSLVYISRL